MAKKKTIKQKKKLTKKSAKKKSSQQQKTYLVTYHSPASAMKKIMNATPEEMEAGLNEWMKWGKTCGKHLVDFGSPLIGGVNVKSSGISPSKRKITGYSFLQAPNMAAAKKLVRNHPHLSWVKGCEIEVHEAMPMG